MWGNPFGERGECETLERRGTTARQECPFEGTQWKEYPVEERGECETLERRGAVALKEWPVPVRILSS